MFTLNIRLGLVTQHIITSSASDGVFDLTAVWSGPLGNEIRLWSRSDKWACTNQGCVFVTSSAISATLYDVTIPSRQLYKQTRWLWSMEICHEWLNDFHIRHSALWASAFPKVFGFSAQMWNVIPTWIHHNINSKSHFLHWVLVFHRPDH